MKPYGAGGAICFLCHTSSVGVTLLGKRAGQKRYTLECTSGAKCVSVKSTKQLNKA